MCCHDNIPCGELVSKRKPFLFNQNLITNRLCTIQWWRAGRGGEGRWRVGREEEREGRWRVGREEEREGRWRAGTGEEREGRKEGAGEGKRERRGGRDIP